MKENRLLIKIDRSIASVFEFTTNPANTPYWIEHLEIEETSEYPPKLGTTYKNRDASGMWSAYTVTALIPNSIFELTAADGNYHVRYSYDQIQIDSTSMEYFEWVDQGELDQPFTQPILDKLKAVIEMSVPY
jgi:hypothetical protein